MRIGYMASRGLVALAGVLMVIGVSLAADDVQAISATQLATSIPNAKNTYVGHESTCESDLAAARKANPGSARYRAAVSASEPYKYNNWISLRNQPAQKISNLMPAGNISLNLQFNQSLFMCAILVNTASGTATSRAVNRVTNSQYANDRSIVRGGTTPNRADLYQKDAKVVSAEVVSGGGSLSNVNGSRRAIAASSSSRYSFANTIPFTYTANLQKTTQVKIRLSVVEIRSYFGAPGSSSALVSCDHDNGNGTYSQYVISRSGVRDMADVFNRYQNDTACNRVITKTDTIEVRVTPPPVWTTAGSTTVDRTAAAPGDTIKWTHSLTNNGPDKTTKAVTSRVARSGFANNAEYQSATTAIGRAKGSMRSFTTSHTVSPSDVGKTLCQQLRWNPTSSTSNGTGNATNRCVTVRAAWDLAVVSTNSNQTAAPGVYGAYPYASPRLVDAGDGIIFRHTAKNEGIRTSAAFDRWAERSRFAGTAATWVLFGAKTPGNTINAGATRTWNSPSYTARADTLGRILCERHSVQGQSSSSNATRASIGSCITVRENYLLHPSVSLTNGGTVTPGDPIPPFTPTVKNQMGVPVKTTKTLTDKDWQVVRFKLGKNVAIPGPNTGAGTPCAYIGTENGQGCKIAALADGEKLEGKQIFNVGSNPLQAVTGQKVDDDLQMGEKICFMVAVRPYSSATPSNVWAYSQSVCLTVGKTPMIQVWGGDVRVGKGIRMGSSGAATTYGSWGEYGVLSRDDNNDMASGSAWVGGNPSGLSHHDLTFANKSATGVPEYGNFKYTDATPLRAQFTSLVATGGTLTSDVGTSGVIGVNVFRPTANITIGKSTLPAGKTTIINATGRTVTIAGDVTYANGPYSDPSQVPQLIIIARNINIAESVERVDAWMLTSGWIDTCGSVAPIGSLPVSGGLSSTICAKQLVVNGPVATNQLVLKRTWGAEPDAAGIPAGTGRDKPAELFNLRPDAYMWLNYFANRQAQAWTTGINELPARY